MPRKRDENETAFDTLEELIRRDAERDGIPQPAKPKPEKMAVRVNVYKMFTEKLSRPQPY